MSIIQEAHLFHSHHSLKVQKTVQSYQWTQHTAEPLAELHSPCRLPNQRVIDVVDHLPQSWSPEGSEQLVHSDSSS